MYRVTKDLNITGRKDVSYQFEGTYKDCEEYIENAKKTFTPEEKRANEIAWLKEEGKNIDSIFGEDWEQKRAQYDENWDKIRRSKTKKSQRQQKNDQNE